MQSNPTFELPAIAVDLHGLTLSFQTAEPLLQHRFQTVYGHLPRAGRQSRPAGDTLRIEWQLTSADIAPWPPPDLPVLSARELISYYGDSDKVTIRLPRYALLTVDLRQRQVGGVVTRHCLEVYGAFEDVMMISLAPLYRRRGWFPLHAFAALAPHGRVALITGQMGSGKTTTGLALLSAGWKLLSNDSPLLTGQSQQIQVLAYPGQLSAFDDALARFEHLQKFIPAQAGQNSDASQKRVFRAETAFADPWAVSGVAGGVFLPRVAPGLAQSELIPVGPKAALLALMPQAIEGWDKALVGPTLQILRQLVEQVPCYTLNLSPAVEQLPELIAGGMLRRLAASR
ncbi:MAG: hypothetical protein AB1801_19010 [Chloroflexota bacterium]